MKKEMSFGEKLRLLRESKYLTKTDLINMTGFSRKTIYNWEKDLALPRNFQTIEILAKALKVDARVFCDNFVVAELESML